MSHPTDPAPAGPRGLSALLARDPYFGAQAVVAGAIALDYLLPERVTVGPSWLLPSVEALLLAVLVVLSPRREFRRSGGHRRLALGLIGLVSVVNLISLALLVHFLLHHENPDGRQLITAGALLWLTNVLLFGLYFWELDHGGPISRAGADPRPPDFLFPQMTDPQATGAADWSPGLIDYLYVSFTNATAFSPTDTMPLSRQAKVLMSVQSLASLVTIGLIVSRAVNIL